MLSKFMVKNSIKIRFIALKQGIEKFVPPIDLKGIGEIIIEDIDFQNNQGTIIVDVTTSGTVSGQVRVSGEIVLNEAKDKIKLDVDNIEFVELPFALKLTAGLLKQKIISMLESKAMITDQQLLTMINNGTLNLLKDLEEQKGLSAQINLKELEFVYVLTDNDGIEICTELSIEPRIDILRLP